MRTINFRDGVLHAVAFKLGLDPSQSNFLTNHAIPIGTYIDEWVRRLYDARDWPEWAVTRQLPPNSDHVVAWDPLTFSTTAITIRIGRVLKVFLVDPNTTDAPIDTPFTLQDDGVHVGYEHGTTVWIKYLPPPPKFTAAQWNAAATYAKDDPTYSYTTGECYKSKVNNNVGHDPAVEGTPSPPPPRIEIIESRTPDNPGTIERNKVMLLAFTNPDIGDPPPNGTFFSIVVVDEDGMALSTQVHTADGSDSLATIITSLATALAGDLSGFTVTPSATTISFEDNSNFGFDVHTIWTDPDGQLRYFTPIQLQSYIPATAAVDGAPQITRITMDSGTTFPGGTYTLTIIDSAGTDHSVEYESAMTDGAMQILQGLILAIEASTDNYFEGVQLTFNTTLLTLDVSIRDNASVDIVTTVTGSAYWELVPFPRVLADQVIRGAYADLLAEWGQQDKAAAQEQMVPSETATAEANFDTLPNPPLTGQQRQLSRYRI